MQRALLSRAAITLTLVSAVLPALGATYRIPSDDDSIRKADVIVRGRVAAETSFRHADGGIYTDITVAVRRVLKGSMVPSTVVVRQPGGIVGTEGEYYAGIGTFSLDEEVLLFLNPGPEGVFGLTDFALGKFHVGRTAMGREFLRRDGLRDGFILGASSEGGDRRTVDPDRDLEAFERYIVAVRHGILPNADHALPESQNDTTREAAFTLLGVPPGPPARWTQFDSSITVDYTDNATGDAGSNCPTGCHTEVANGIVKWNDLPGVRILLAYGGTDASIGSKCRNQLVDQIQFNDPCDEIQNLNSQCEGTLALGGYTFTASGGGTPSCPAKGNPTFGQILFARILMNNGVGSCSSIDSCDYTGIIAHETGHTIGAGHSDVPSALMFPFINTGQCGIPAADDIAFAQCAYQETALSCDLTATPSTGEHPLLVTFNAGATGGTAPYTFDYDFGDGTSSTATAPTHTYTSPATYDADVVVMDSDGTSCNDSVSVTVLPCTAPVLTSVTAKLRTNGLVRAIVVGTGFKKGSVVQFDSGGGFVSGVTTRKSKTKLIVKDSAALWPVGTVDVRVLSSTGCPSNVVQATR